MNYKRAPIALMFGLSFVVIFAAGCSRNNGVPYRITNVQASSGVSGGANPGGDSYISTTVDGPEANAGGSGLSDTRGTSVTGAKAYAGTPQLGETGEVLTSEQVPDASPPTGSAPAPGGLRSERTAAAPGNDAAAGSPGQNGSSPEKDSRGMTGSGAATGNGTATGVGVTHGPGKPMGQNR